MMKPNVDYKPTRTVLVVGASVSGHCSREEMPSKRASRLTTGIVYARFYFFQYAGYRAVQRLVKELPKGWRVVVLERNTHMNREN